MQRLWVVQTIDLSNTGRSGEKVAPTVYEMGKCDCCGKRIKYVNVLNNGKKVGSECVQIINRLSISLKYEVNNDITKFNEYWTPDTMYIFRVTKKQLAFFKAQ